MFTHKLWLLAVPVAALALQGCSGGNNIDPDPAPDTNIARYSDANASNVNFTPWFARIRGKSLNSFNLQEFDGVGNEGRQLITNLSTARAPEPGAGTPVAPYQAGQTYPLAPEPAGTPTNDTVQATLTQRSPGMSANSDGMTWQAVGGNLIIDRVVGAANNPSGYFFHIDNARFAPDPDNAGGATGTFTFNYSGNAGTVN